MAIKFTRECQKYLDTYYLFNKMIGLIFQVILVFFIIVLCAATVKLFGSLGGLLQAQKIAGSYKDLIADVFTLYILIELSRSLVEYFHTHHLRLSLIIDAAIVFILRDIMMHLYMKKFDPTLFYSLTALLLVLGLLRTASVYSFSREVLMMKKVGLSDSGHLEEQANADKEQG